MRISRDKNRILGRALRLSGKICPAPTEPVVERRIWCWRYGAAEVELNHTYQLYRDLQRGSRYPKRYPRAACSDVCYAKSLISLVGATLEPATR